MTNEHTDDGELDNDASAANVANVVDEPTATMITRRDAIKAGAGAVAATTVLAGAGGVGSVAAAEDGAIYDDVDEMEKDIRENNGLYQMGSPAVRASVGLGLQTMRIAETVDEAIGDGVYGALKAQNEFLFGSHNPDPAINEDAHNAAWAHIGDSAISIRDALATWEQNGMQPLEYMSYTIMESEAVQALNDNETKGSAKTRAKQRIRDEVLVTPEANLIRLGEAMGIRLAGIVRVWLAGLDEDGYMADDDDDGTMSPRPNSFWKYDLDGADYGYMPENEDDIGATAAFVFQINTPQPSTYTLINGEELDVNLCQINTATELGEDDPADTFNVFPVGDKNRFSIAPRRHFSTTNNGYHVRSWDQLAFYHAGEDTNRTVSDYISWEQINTLYDDLMELKDTLDTEVEEYVDALYSKYDPGDIVDPEDRTPGSLTYDSGNDYTTSGDSDYSEIWAALYNFPIDSEAGKTTVEVLSGGEVTDTHEGIVIPQANDSDLPRIEYAAEDYTLDVDAGTLTVDRKVIAPGTHVFTWNDGSEHTVEAPEADFVELTNDSDEVTGHEYTFADDDDAPTASPDSHSMRTDTAGLALNQEASILTYVAVYVETSEDDDFNGGMETIDPSSSSVDAWRATSIESDAQWFLAFEKTRPTQTSIDNEELQDLWDKYAKLQEELAKEREKNNTNPGGADPDGGDNTLLYVAGGAVAALLAALGLQGAGGSGGGRR